MKYALSNYLVYILSYLYGCSSEPFGSASTDPLVAKGAYAINRNMVKIPMNPRYPLTNNRVVSILVKIRTTAIGRIIDESIVPTKTEDLTFE